MAKIYKSELGRRAVEEAYRKALERWPVPNRQLVVPTCQGDTFVVVSGEARRAPIVLLHGSGANSTVWIRDVAELAQRYRVYSVDIIGEPGFSAASRPPLRSDAHASWMEDVWRGLGVSAAAIVGVSFGAWLGLDYAVRRPDRVRALCLLSPAGIGRQNPWFLVRAGLLLMRGRSGRRQSFRLVAGPAELPRPAIEFVTLIFQHFRPRMERLPLRTDQELAGLSVPVRVVLGGRDAMIRSRETRTRAERLIRNLQLTYLDDEGHLLPRQTRAIADFLDRVTQPAQVSMSQPRC